MLRGELPTSQGYMSVICTVRATHPCKRWWCDTVPFLPLLGTDGETLRWLRGRRRMNKGS